MFYCSGDDDHEAKPVSLDIKSHSADGIMGPASCRRPLTNAELRAKQVGVNHQLVSVLQLGPLPHYYKVAACSHLRNQPPQKASPCNNWGVCNLHIAPPEPCSRSYTHLVDGQVVDYLCFTVHAAMA